MQSTSTYYQINHIQFTRRLIYSISPLCNQEIISKSISSDPCEPFPLKVLSMSPSSEPPALTNPKHSALATGKRRHVDSSATPVTSAFVEPGIIQRRIPRGHARARNAQLESPNRSRSNRADSVHARELGTIQLILET